jgi:hypothetical protein
MNKPSVNKENMVPISGYRENVRIVVEGHSPRITVEAYKKNSEHSTVIRNYFTLTGTRDDGSCLRRLAGQCGFSGHFGYTSVGKMEESGAGLRTIERGSMVILAAQFSKYVDLYDSQIPLLRKVFLTSIPANIDPVNSLFLPMICVALKLYHDMEDAFRNGTAFLGCGLAGVVFLKLLNINGIHPDVCPEKGDISREIISRNGAGYVAHSDSGALWETELHENVFVFSESASLTAVRRKYDDSVARILEVSRADEGGDPWYSHDLAAEAADLIASGIIDCTDLIAGHIHAESAGEISERYATDLNDGRKFFVYDW